MFKFLLSPKWLILTLVAVILLPTFKSLSDWQYRRLAQRQAHNSVVINAKQQPATSFESLTSNGSLGNPNDEWRTVTATGNFLQDQTYLLRKRSLDSEAGLWVVTPFKLLNGNVITVVRGWTPAAASAKETPTLSPLPTEQVALTGRMRLMSATPSPEPSDLPARQRLWLNPDLGTAYLELVSSEPELNTPEITLLPAPELSEGNHHSYAIQWLLFAAMLVIGYAVLLRTDYLAHKVN